MDSDYKNKFESVDSLQEWGSHFRDKNHPVALTLFRAAALIVTDIQAMKNLDRLSVTSCENCPFYSDKYCGLSQRLNAQYGTDHPTFVVNEWKQGITPTRCPLRNADMLISKSAI
jgi:hypothetical protein